MQILQLVQSYN